MIKLYFDGSCLFNPGNISSCGCVIYQDNKKIWQASVTIDEEKSSNNVAEYSGLIIGLLHLLDKGFKDEEIQVIGDSKLVIAQLFRGWKVKGGYYEPYYHYAKSLVEEFSNIRGKLIPRHKNEEADSLSKVYSTDKISLLESIKEKTLF